jgi:anaerobic selenocysteine-containing dehydrogenase
MVVGKMEKVNGVCGICPGGCGVDITLKDGKIVSVKPTEGHPLGIVCPRGARSHEVVYSPDRLKYPMRRTGERGSGEFERVSWDEALDHIAENLKRIADEHGARSIMHYIGRGNFEQSLQDMLAPQGTRGPGQSNLFFPLGSPNSAGCGSICFVSYGVFAPLTTFGTGIKSTYNDYQNSDLIVVWGANPATDSPPIALRHIQEAKQRGAEVIVIDHLRSETARRTNAEWIPVRPGSDGALALSMLNVIIEEGLYDREFVDKWTHGFEEFKTYAQQFPPEKVETICRVGAETIRATARKIARAKGASLCSYTGLEYTDSGVQNIRATLILWALAGHLDVPGGLVFYTGKPVKYNRREIPLPEGDLIGSDRYPLYTKVLKTAHFMEAPRAILDGDPYPIKALVIGGSSLLTSYADVALWERCLSALKFLVVVDRFMTADARFADVILPAATNYETDSYVISPQHVQLRRKVIEPIGEARGDYTIYANIADRLGYGDFYPQSEEAMVEYVFRDSDIPLDELKANPAGVRIPLPEPEYKKYEKGMLRRDGKPGFNTPTGKFEIASSLLAKYGYESLPKYEEPAEGPLASPEMLDKFPLILNTGARIQSTFRSQHLNIPGLLRMQPDPQILIHPDDAREREIEDGDKVLVKTERGEVAYQAKVTDGIMPGVIEANVGGGGPLGPVSWQKANTNYLTDHHNRDPISGFPVFKALLCQVEKA